MEKRLTDISALIGASVEEVSNEIVTNYKQYTKDDFQTMYAALHDAKTALTEKISEELRTLLPEKVKELGWDNVYVHFGMDKRWDATYNLNGRVVETCYDEQCGTMRAFAVVCHSSDIAKIKSDDANEKNMLNALCGWHMFFDEKLNITIGPEFCVTYVTDEKKYDNRWYSKHDMALQLKVDKRIKKCSDEFSAAFKSAVQEHAAEWKALDDKQYFVSTAYYFEKRHGDDTEKMAKILSVLHHEFANISVQLCPQDNPNRCYFLADTRPVTIDRYWEISGKDRSDVCSSVRTCMVNRSRCDGSVTVKGMSVSLNPVYLSIRAERMIFAAQVNDKLSVFDSEAPAPKCPGRKKKEPLL